MFANWIREEELPVAEPAVIEPTGNVRVLPNTIGGVDVIGANLRARHAYEMAWAARFHFPAPVELLDRWWPNG